MLPNFVELFRISYSVLFWTIHNLIFSYVRDFCVIFYYNVLFFLFLILLLFFCLFNFWQRFNPLNFSKVRFYAKENTHIFLILLKQSGAPVNYSEAYSDFTCTRSRLFGLRQTVINYVHLLFSQQMAEIKVLVWFRSYVKPPCSKQMLKALIQQHIDQILKISHVLTTSSLFSEN